MRSTRRLTALYSQKAPWDSFTAAVIYKRNHPMSVKAKTTLQGLLCTRFGIKPCEPHPDAPQVNLTLEHGAVAMLST